MSHTKAEALEIISSVFEIPTNSVGRAIQVMKEKYAGQDVSVYVEMIKTITGSCKHVVVEVSDYTVWVMAQYVVQHYITTNVETDCGFVIEKALVQANKFVKEHPYLADTKVVTNTAGEEVHVARTDKPKAAESVKERAIRAYNALTDKSRESVMVMLNGLGLEKNTANAYYSRLKRGVWA